MFKHGSICTRHLITITWCIKGSYFQHNFELDPRSRQRNMFLRLKYGATQSQLVLMMKKLQDDAVSTDVDFAIYAKCNGPDRFIMEEDVLKYVFCLPTLTLVLAWEDIKPHARQRICGLHVGR